MLMNNLYEFLSRFYKKEDPTALIEEYSTNEYIREALGHGYIKK